MSTKTLVRGGQLSELAQSPWRVTFSTRSWVYWVNLGMGIVERSGIWDCDDVIVEVSVGVWCVAWGI